MKKIKFTLLLFAPSIIILLIFSRFFAGCCPDGGCNCTWGNIDTNQTTSPYCEIDQITNSGDVFTIPVKAGGWGAFTTASGYIEIKKSTGCLSYTSETVNIVENSPYPFSVNANNFNFDCNGHDTYYVTAHVTSSKTGEMLATSSFVWGVINPGLTQINVHLDQYKMLHANTDSCTSALTCVTSSFNYQDVKVNPILKSTFYGVRDESFDGIDFDNIAYPIDTFVHNNKNIYSTDTFKIYYALDHKHTGSNNNYIGLSTFNSQHIDTNWSFVFTQYIKWALENHTPANDNLQTAYNEVSVHELLHQMGHIGDSGHLGHTNPYASSCALWVFDHFDTTGENQELTTFFHVCKTHTDALRTNLGGTLNASGKNNYTILPFPLHQNNDKQAITMSLAKKVYKEYENVIARFELVNNNDKPYEVYDMFNPYFNTSGTTIKIEDNLGNTWMYNRSPGDFVPVGPNYILQPKDTLIVSMPINNWGEIISERYGLFSQFGYFPAGRKYKATFYFNNNALVSNTVEFEVTNTNFEDNELVKLYKDIFGKYTFDDAASIAISKYPDNTFTEYFWANKLSKKYSHKIEKWSRNEVINNYQKFFNKYPDSYYVFDDNFMYPFYYELFYNSANFNAVLSDLLQNNKSNQLGKLLQYNNTKDRIKLILNNNNRK